ncbi:hypothetical protein WG66_013644 [Moniliophthora roreri]|uniref:GmrSD restriction endonucleases N-terminal domain-containing protein n=1 Tax=Moniliophthora roreri TaxID=221103 RepID=A0A0W0FZ22_MONRR|nr:hypothetical protein WG66_013644 [Moniliophthora roreri]
MASDDEMSSQLTDEDRLDAELTLSISNAQQHNSEESEAQDYTLQNALKPPRATTYTAQALFEQIKNRAIDLNPEYQRDVVWTTQKQIQLIDSIFRNYYIPPIIFAVTIHDDGSESRTCIDGKQRLTSIRLFMDGVIPHKDVHTNQQLWFKDNRSVGKSTSKMMLPDKYRQIFANKQVVCVEYGEVKQSDERDIFRRVQLGIALTPAEKLQATSTPRADFVRGLLSKYTTETTLGSPVVSWDRERARDFHVFSVAVCSLAKWNVRSGLDNLPTLQQVEAWMREKRSQVGGRKRRKSDAQENVEFAQVSDAFAERVDRGFEVLAMVATSKKYNKPFLSTSGISAKVSPIEMVGCIMLTYMTATTVAASSTKRMLDPDTPKNLERLSHLITIMRTQMRELHTDSRMNAVVGRTMFDFILEAGRNPFTYEGLTPGTDPEYEEEEETRPAEKTKKNKRSRLAGCSSRFSALQKARQSASRGRSHARVSTATPNLTNSSNDRSKSPLPTRKKLSPTNTQHLPSPEIEREREAPPSAPPLPIEGQMDIIQQTQSAHFMQMMNSMIAMNPAIVTQWTSYAGRIIPQASDVSSSRFSHVPSEAASSISRAGQSEE